MKYLPVPRLKPEPLDQDSSTLTVRSVHLLPSTFKEFMCSLN